MNTTTEQAQVDKEVLKAEIKQAVDKFLKNNRQYAVTIKAEPIYTKMNQGSTMIFGTNYDIDVYLL